MGFLGGLDRATNGTFTTYFANYSTEVVFHVSTLIPNSAQARLSFRFLLIFFDGLLVAVRKGSFDWREYRFHHLDGEPH